MTQIPEQVPAGEALAAELARRSLKEFIHQAWSIVEPTTQLVWGWHLDAICVHLQAVTEGRIRRLLVNIPPGHMKSLIVSVFWPAWVWTTNPGWRGLFASYTLPLSIRDSVKCRAIVESPWYREHFAKDWRLSGDQNVKSFFQNTCTGFRLSLSVGSGTGFRGDAMVVDDPIKADDAYSRLARDEAIRWWDLTMSSRLNDMATGARVIIMQRLHEEDLSGHVLKQGGYEHLCLPSEFDPARRSRTSIGWEDPRERPGDLLFADKFPHEVLAQARHDLQSDYAGQHQQTPAPAKGGVFQRDWFQRYRTPPAQFDEVIQSWDLSFKGKDDSDYVVGQVWGRKGADCYLLDQVRDHLSYPQSRQAFRDVSARWPKATAKLVEDKANGPAIMDDLRREIPGLIAIEPDGSKEARAHAVSPLCEGGNVWIPASAPWVNDWLHEVTQFPRGAHDDQVDAMTQALRRFRQPNGLDRLRRLASL